MRLLGCHACVVDDGDQAVAQLQQQAFDLLITDLFMPGLNGYGLARCTRVKWRRMPVVAAPLV